MNTSEDDAATAFRMCKPADHVKDASNEHILIHSCFLSSPPDRGACHHPVARWKGNAQLVWHPWFAMQLYTRFGVIAKPGFQSNKTKDSAECRDGASYPVSLLLY